MKTKEYILLSKIKNIASKRFGNEKLLQKVNMGIEIKKRLNISQYNFRAKCDEQ
jgi:hypothetical protein